MERVRKLLVLLLVFAYTGQGLAAIAPPCHGMAASGESAGVQKLAQMQHAGHTMPAPADEVTKSGGDGDCCDSGLCNMSHCHSVIALPMDPVTGTFAFAMRFVYSAGTTSAFHPSESLYRPPIRG